MSEAAKTHLNHVLPQSRFEIGQFISDGWSIFKKGFGPFLGFILVFAFIAIIVNMIPILGMLASQLIITPALTAGAYLYSHSLKRNQNPEFGVFFSGFEYWAQLLVLYFIYLVLAMVFLIPFFFSAGFDALMNWGTPEMINDFADFNMSAFLWFIPMMLALLLLSYAIHFVVFYKLSATDAISYSIKFCAKHYIYLLLFVIITMLIGMSGVIGLGIGILLTISAVYTLSYASFSGLTRLDDFLDGDPEQAVVDSLIEE